MIHERGDTDGDGPATQNRRRFGGFDFAIDEPGFSLVDWRHFVVEANRRVGPGRGAVTNVFGWRTLRQEALIDIDATVDPVFHGFTFTDQEQLSNELRYSGWFSDGWQATSVSISSPRIFGIGSAGCCAATSVRRLEATRTI